MEYHATTCARMKTKLTQDVDEADNTNAAGVSLYYII